MDGATVILTDSVNEMVRITDEYGEAIFNNLEPGWDDLEISKDGATAEDEVYVNDFERRRHVVILG